MTPMDGLKIFSELTSTGALIWVVYYTLSRGIPDIIARFSADATAARTAFMNELSQARADFRAEIRAERDHCREEMSLLRGAGGGLRAG